MRLPFISRAHHLAVVEGRDAQISLLLSQLSALQQQVDKGTEERHHLTESITAIATYRPEPVGATPGPRRMRRPPAEPPLNLDPADNASLVQQAILETGSRNATVVLRQVELIRARLIAGQRPNPNQAFAPRTQVTEGEDPGKAKVMALIDEALASGERAGRGEAA